MADRYKPRRHSREETSKASHNRVSTGPTKWTGQGISQEATPETRNADLVARYFLGNMSYLEILKYFPQFEEYRTKRNGAREAIAEIPGLVQGMKQVLSSPKQRYFPTTGKPQEILKAKALDVLLLKIETESPIAAIRQ